MATMLWDFGGFDFDMNQTNQLEKIAKSEERIQELIPPLLQQTAPLITDWIKYYLHPYVKTGALIDSIKQTRPVHKNYNWIIVIKPTGTDENGMRNIEKMAYLEYGYYTHEGKLVPPKAVLERAMQRAEPFVMKEIEEAFGKEWRKWM